MISGEPADASGSGAASRTADRFIWGTAASATQTEGAAPGSDWAWLAGNGLVPPTGLGNGFGTAYREDFRLYAENGLRHHRLSLEWARIEPERGHRDPGAVAHYRDVLGAARDVGIEPWVCLLHFTTPAWFSVQERGFAGDATRALEIVEEHAGFVADTFGDLVAGWQPVNEPVGYAMNYLAAIYPELRDPGRLDETIDLLHRTVATVATLLAPSAPVATINNLGPVHPADDSAEAVHAASVLDHRLWRSWNKPEFLAGVDWCGFSYYHAIAVDGTGAHHPYPSGARVSEMGYSPSVAGFRQVLDRLARDQSLPLLVAELGIGTHDQVWQAEHLDDCLSEIDMARGQGVDIRGCFFWTGVDNFEWLRAFDVPFGLFDVDRKARPALEVVRRHMRRRGTGRLSRSISPR